MTIFVELHWTFTPVDYFERAISDARKDYVLSIDDGKASVGIDEVLYDANPSMQTTLHRELENRFLIVQVLTNLPFQLSQPNRLRRHPDGRVDRYIEVATGHMTMSMGTVDVQISGPNGKVVYGSAAARVEQKRSLAEQAAKHHNDSVLASILRSYGKALADSANELVHLFEIPDALKNRFRGKVPAQKMLGITNAQWSRLTRLCNDEPLQQGRHRGQQAGRLRNASSDEIIDARAIARGMIEAYLAYLTTGNPQLAGASITPEAHRK